MYQRYKGGGWWVGGIYLVFFLVNIYTCISFPFFLFNVDHRYAQIKFKLLSKLRKSNRKLKSPLKKFVKIAPWVLKIFHAYTKYRYNHYIKKANFTIDTLVLVYQKALALTSCKESAKTVRHTERCPVDLKSWEKAAKNMNCEDVKQNCSQIYISKGQHRFQYHCVINAWMNATFEVCAPNRTIFGMLLVYIQLK